VWQTRHRKHRISVRRRSNGTSVRLNLLVADPDAFAGRAIANGATEIAPIADQPYGLRQGRLADPFGHHWLIGRPLAGESGDWARQTGH
jgi:PhnB protein